MKITPAMLREKDACEDQYSRFVELFPNGVEITLELCIMYAGEFNFPWAARNLLGLDQRKAFEEAVAPHHEAYNEAMAQHRKAYNEAIAPLAEAYNEAIAPLAEAIGEAIAREFFRCSQIQLNTGNEETE